MSGRPWRSPQWLSTPFRDWIKRQVTAIETGILSFEGAFLGQILLPNGRTVLEEATERQMLPKPQEPSA